MICSFKDSNLLEKKYMLAVEAYYFTNWRNYSMDFHSHNRVEIMFVDDGKCTVETCDKTIGLKKNDCIILDANVKHNLKAEKCRIMNLEFSFTETDDDFYSLRFMTEKNERIKELFRVREGYVMVSDTFSLGACLRNIILTHSSKNTNELIMQTYYIQFLANIGELIHSQRKTEERSFYIERAKEYIRANYDRDIKIDDISRELNISSAYLFKLFNKYMSKTPNDYLLGVRLEKSKMLLENSDYTVTQIAGFSGFSNLQHYSYAFKKMYGLSPKEYRLASIEKTSGHQTV